MKLNKHYLSFFFCKLEPKQTIHRLNYQHLCESHPLLDIQTFTRIGGKEERTRSTISEEEDGGRDPGREEDTEEDEGLQAVVILITKVSLLITLVVEDLQTRAGPADTLATDHGPTEGDTTWLRGDAIFDPTRHLRSSPLLSL